MKERMNGVKKKRVCSEWRKARSRVAARGRRERECGLFGELLRGLPLPQPVVAHLDKASVIRLTLSYLRLRALLDAPDCAVNAPHCTLEGTRPVTLQSSNAGQGYEPDVTSCVEMVLDSALEGFLLLLSRDGQVIYTTEAISMHTGIKQVDLIGQCLYDFMHPCDQQEAREILSSKSGVEECQKCDLFFRMRCTLTPQRRNVNLKSSTWKVVHCTGVRKLSVPAGSVCLVLLCQSLPVPMSGAYDTNLNCSAFLSKHSPDMRFTYCQPRVFQLTGYTETDLLGHSVYQYYHASDCQHVHKAHLSLFSKGQTSTGKYRLLVKHGGYVWVETVATVVYNSRTGQLQSVICINYILSEVEQSGVMFSLEQMERLLKPLASSPAPVSPLLLPGAILLDELSQKAADPRDRGSTWTREYEGHLNDIPEKDNFTTCHDLETLAPYIPMDGEDFLLSPLSDMEGVEHEGQELLHPFPLSFPNLEIKSHASPLSHLNHMWARLTPHMSSQSPPNYYSSGNSNQAHTLMTEHGGDSGRGCRQRSGQGWWQPQKRYRENMHLSPGPYPQCCPPMWPSQHTAPSLKTLKNADSSYNTNCTPCWWSPDGSVCRCGPVPWAPGHTDFSINIRNQQHPIRDPHRTVLLRCGSALPVLSRWECEVNAPLDPSSCLLHGAEILSVLDQAMSRLPP
ncbi:hypoxia inducible factor 1 subunit alpha, like 2 isoform X2 [Anguilla anguilla]|uniref:hypoxia inducible factor 1 subunit alpha, like 2 isoform X2 n=1 Tax=Anguilla anguilla TaxID=7936 RepID=UPI0015ABDC25|nr:hypoxia inducible factor 1 subunit alpha, like 2 isoform X2 [Anguilla anguilla]